MLKEVLPVNGTANAETIRTHMQFTAERIERSLGAERQLNEYEGTEDQWEALCANISETFQRF